MPDTASISITFDRTDNAAFSGIAKGSANRFFAMRLTCSKEGTLMRRCVADFGFFFCWRPGLSGNPGVVRRIRLGGHRSNAARAIGGNPSSAESIDAGGAAWRLVRSTTATAGEAAILHTADIGTIIPTGAEMRLPGDATSLVTGQCHMARELEIKVAAGGAEIDGTVALSGLPKALQSPNAECGQK
jgi:hypothetical protein